jgi:hypothetical protein
VVAPELVDLQRGQLRQAHRQDRVGLDDRQLEALDQPVAGGGAVARPADQRDDLVEVGLRDEQALEDVEVRLLLGELVLGPPDDDVALVLDVVVDDLAQGQRPRDAVDQRDGVDAERRLHRRVLEELVEDDLADDAALHLDHQAHAVAVGLVADVGDLGDLLLVDELDDLGDQPVVAALLDHERQLGDDQRLLALADLLDADACLHAHATAARLVGIADALVAEDDPAGREVRALDVPHQALDGDVGVVDVGDDPVDDLAQVVRRDVGGHADGDAAGAVDEQVREARRQHDGLALAAVVVGDEVDGVGVEVAQHLGRHAIEARLRVPHGRRRVVVDRAEVALAVDERVAQREVLRHAHERVVDRGVAVRVVVAHHLADDPRGLGVRPRRAEAQLAHAVEHTAVDGLQAVTDVRQRTPDDDRHRVVEIRTAHLVFERTGLDVAAGQDP